MSQCRFCKKECELELCEDCIELGISIDNDEYREANLGCLAVMILLSVASIGILYGFTKVALWLVQQF